MAVDPGPSKPLQAERPGPPRKASILARRWFPWAVVGALVACALPLAALVAFVVDQEQEEDPPTCYGIGFGCVPGPWSTAALVGMIFYAPVVWGLAALLGVLEIFGRRAQAVRSTLALVVAAALLGISVLYIVQIAAA